MTDQKDNSPVILTKDEIRSLVRETVEETLTKFGVDTSDPIQLQRDSQFVRDLRKASESAKGKAIMAIVTLLVTTLLGALVIGVKAVLRSN